MPGTTVDPVEEIATRSRILTRASVLGLIGCVVLIAAGIAWALFARVPDTIAGEGVILPESGFAEVGTALDGIVEDVAVAPGASVTRGEVLMTVDTGGQRPEPITAPVTGQVVYVFARPGRPTLPGEPLAILRPEGENVARAFLPADQAEIVRPGMQAWVSPSSAPRGQYGFIVGTVTQVAPAPATREHLLTVLGDNADLADYLLSGGPVQEVRVDLNPADTPSGYEWTIGTGPDFTIASSTLAVVAVVRSDRSVMSWLIP
jgi:multidrug efflux pump subunit AcrA (membrane-fusion protein)